jgi:hypothetical protein
LFHDTSTDITNKYSPYAPYIVNNTFNGYTSTDVTVCLFLTGAIKFTVRDNKLINMNEATALRPLMIYSNDYGPYDEDGTARAYIEGEVVNNIIHGTFKDGLEVRGLSPNGLATWTNSYEMRVNVSGNKIVGTGHGLKFEEVYNTRASNNYVSVSGSPLYLDQHIVHVGIYNNYLQSLTNGYDDTTIYAGWASGSGGFVFEGNRVYTPTGSLYALRSQTTATWVDLNNNYWFFDADQSGARTIVLTNASKLRISKNTFNIETDQLIYALVLTGSGSRASCDIKDNDVVSINGTGAATFRFADITSFEDVNVSDNITGGAISITGSDRVRVSSNTMIMPSSNSVRAVYVDNSAYNAQTFAWIDKNYIYNSGALNSPGIGVASYNNASNNTLSKVSMNYVSGNSSGALIQQTTHGTIEHIGNTIVNAGGGGTSTAVTGSATSTAL